MTVYVTRSRTLDLLLGATLALLIAVTSLRLAVYHTVDPERAQPKLSDRVDVQDRSGRND